MSIEFSRKRKSQVARMRSDLEELREDNKILFEDCEQLRRACDEWKQRRDLAIQRAEKAEVKIEQLRQELGYIANAQRKNFVDAEEFWAWAQNRARHALNQKPGELAIKKP